MRSALDQSAPASSLRLIPPSAYHPASSAIFDSSPSASTRLRALAMLSGSLTDALSPVEAADLVEKEALSILGASSAVVVTLGDSPPAAMRDGVDAPEATAPCLVLVHGIGVSPDALAEIRKCPLDSPVPLAEVARTGEAIFLESEEELRTYSEWGARALRDGERAAAIVPVWANGELRGVLGLTWSTPRLFDEDERAFVITLGVMCAQAIMRAHLRANEHRAREDAEHANRSKAHFWRRSRTSCAHRSTR